jgi:hypothetical protein
MDAQDEAEWLTRHNTVAYALRFANNASGHATALAGP